MKIISLPTLARMLIEAKAGATFSGLVTETIPALKAGNPFDNLKKVATRNVTLGADYSASVNRQLTRENETADFLAAPRKWGKRLTRNGKNTFLVIHKRNLYLSTIQNNSQAVFMDSGREVTKEDVSPWLRDRGASRQGTEKRIEYLDIGLASIRELSFQGERFIVAK